MGSDGQGLASRGIVVYKTKLPAPKPIPSPVESISFRDDGVILVNGEPLYLFYTTWLHETATSPLTSNSFNLTEGNFGLLPEALHRAKVYPYNPYEGAEKIGHILRGRGGYWYRLLADVDDPPHQERFKK